MMQERAETSRDALQGSRPERPVLRAVLRGAALKCPACGVGLMFPRYLKVADHCSHCGEALHHQRADDAPPYFTIAIVGHVVIGLMLAVEMAYRPALWLHAALWVPLTLILSLLLLPSVKGTLVALQWALRMHGFDPNSEEEIGLAARDPGPPPRLDFRP
jgi:uncharacterized protein (DUF983 family)